jgi:septum formation protein
VQECHTIVESSDRKPAGSRPHPSNRVDLVLASASPRRRELLSSLGISFRVVPANIDERCFDTEGPMAYVQRMASEKALTVSALLGPEGAVGEAPRAILAADTVVCLGDKLFGKPVDESDAMDMWRNLSGKTHEVYTALTLCYGALRREETSISRVGFRNIPESEMRAYWSSGEPRDKAGGYAIQGLGSAWVERVEGSYTGIVGLPMYELNRVLTVIGENWL